MLFQKIGEAKVHTGEVKDAMRIHIFDRIFDELPINYQQKKIKNVIVKRANWS